MFGVNQRPTIQPTDISDSPATISQGVQCAQEYITDSSKWRHGLLINQLIGCDHLQLGPKKNEQNTKKYPSLKCVSGELRLWVGRCNYEDNWCWCHWHEEKLIVWCGHTQGHTVCNSYRGSGRNYFVKLHYDEYVANIVASIVCVTHTPFLERRNVFNRSCFSLWVLKVPHYLYLNIVYKVIRDPSLVTFFPRKPTRQVQKLFWQVQKLFW